MSRLTKPLLKTAIQQAILGDGTGQCQMILTRPADEGFRLAVAGQVAPGGGMVASRTPGKSGTVYSQNLMGDTPNRALGSAPSYDPKFVSVNPYLNPYLDYLLDKLAEGIAEAHQDWQVRQRVRGITLVAAGPKPHVHQVNEMMCHLPFQTEQVVEDQSDHETRGDLIDTSLRDFTERIPIRAQLYTMLAEKAQNVNTSAEALGGMDPDKIPVWSGDAQATRTQSLKMVSRMLVGSSQIDTPHGLIASDQGKYGKGQAPGGLMLNDLFMFETWRKLVNVLKEQVLRLIPPGQKLNTRGMDLANLAAGNMTQSKPSGGK